MARTIAPQGFTGRIDPAGNRKTLECMAYTLHRLWQSMMIDLGLPEDSKFVTVDCLEESRFYPFYELATNQFIAARREAAAGGYIGLRIA